MDVLREKSWYVVQTKRRREDLAAMNISRLGLEVFLPKVKQDSGSREVVKPFFPEYLFVRFCPLSYLHSIRFARGVRRVVCGGNLPLPVDDGIVEAIRSRAGKQGCIELEDSNLSPGERVIINDGPLRGSRGLFERELKDGERVVILLEKIGYQARVLIEKPAVIRILPESA